MGNALAVHGYENLLMLTSAKDFPKPPIEGRFIHKGWTFESIPSENDFYYRIRPPDDMEDKSLNNQARTICMEAGLNPKYVQFYLCPAD